MLRFDHWLLGPLALICLSSTGAPAGSVCDAAVPQLAHSAPWVGGSFELALDGAAPGASVRVFHSPEAGQFQTPYGLLELERSLLDLAASGQADAQGHWAVQLLIPLDASLAEVEGHYQALVQDPAGTAMLSSAVHLRYLGPRSYTLCAGDGSAPPSLDVHAITDGTPVASVALAAWPPTFCSNYPWQPAFSANLAQGAFLSGCNDIVVLDNFDLTVRAVLAVETPSNRLLSSADGRLAYVIEDPASGAPRIRALDLESASFVATLQLPDTCTARWCKDDASPQAFVQETDPVTGELLARRVDLEGWQVLDTLSLGFALGSNPGWLESQRGWLYASAVKSGSIPFNSFSAVDLLQPGASPSVVIFGYWLPGSLVVVPSVERLFVSGSSTMGPEPDVVRVAPLDAPQRLTTFPPPFFPFQFGAGVVRDDRVWVLSKSFDSDYPGRLWNLDALALTWRDTDEDWYYPWPVTLLAARGPLVDVLLMPRTGSRSGQATFDPEMIVLDPNTGAITGSWPLSWGAVAGYVLQPE